jgi:glutamine synthetase
MTEQLAVTPDQAKASALLAQTDEDRISELWVLCHDFSGRGEVKSVPRAKIAQVLSRGASFCRANFDYNVLDEMAPDFIFGAETGDVLAVPDPETYAVVPLHPGAARVYSFLHERDGSLWAGCARGALQAIAERFASLGLSLRAAFEPEFYLLANTEAGPEPLARAGMFSINALDTRRDLMSTLQKTLAQMGVALEQVGPEYGPGQFEINIAHQPALKAADDLMTVKEVLRALARAAGLTASFMPKIRRDLPGCGMHVHIGLTTADGANAVEGDQAMGLSELGACVVAGLLKHARGLAGLTAPTVNSYKRLLPGSWAPSHVCYGGSNRAALVRIPDAGTRHLEFRGGDGTGNPYLSLVGIMAAALDGIEEGRPATDPITDGLAGLTPADFAARGLVELPRSAPEALDALEADQVLMDALGPIIGPGFLRVRRSEAATYALEVGDWERAAYLEQP